MTFSQPIWLLLLPAILGGAIWAWAGRHRSLGSRRRLVSLLLRLIIFTALILAIAGATWQRPRSEEAVTFVGDLSASMLSGQDRIVRYINSALKMRRQSDRAAIVAFGQAALVEQPSSPLTGFDHFESLVDGDFSDLGSGLGLGGALLPNDHRRRVILLTDGRENLGDAVGQTRLLHNEGIRVDVVQIPTNPGPEVRVNGVDAPSNLHLGEQFTLNVQVSSTVATQATVLLFEDGQLVKSSTATIQQGDGVLSFNLTARHTGVHTYRAVLQPTVDTISQNNEGSTFVTVVGPPQVLVVEGFPGFSANVVASLHAAHIQTSIITGFALPSDLATLQQYAAIVLVDVPADELAPESMRALQSFVGDLGHGLVALGGANSFGVGNYGGTPLEEALPVRMDLPKRKDLPTAAVVLIIESLESQANVNISKQAGKAVVGLLNPHDQIAVSDANAGYTVPLQNAQDKAGIDSAIDNMNPNDPMSYLPFLQQAYDTLRQAKAQTKHIILLGDGDAYDNAYQTLLTKIRKAGINVSTVETNASVSSDFQTMRDIARWGGGKNYPADNVTSIPRILLKVARTVAHSSIIEGRFYPAQVAPSPILNGITSVTDLQGYVVTTPKQLATIVLVSPKSDPILAQWQFGLGRAVAWTSDSQGRWTTDWLASPSTKRIWSAMVNWVLPPPQSADLSLSTTVAGGIATLGLDSQSSTVFRTITAHVVGPDGKAQEVSLIATAPHHYEGRLLTGGDGAYLVRIAAQAAGAGKGSGLVRTISGGLVVPYAPDYRETGPDPSTSQAIASAGGGSVLSLSQPNLAWVDNLPSVPAPTPLQTPLLLMALLLLPFDVAARRLLVRHEDWQALLAALPRRRRDAQLSGDAEPTIAALSTVRKGRAARQQSAPMLEKQPAPSPTLQASAAQIRPPEPESRQSIDKGAEPQEADAGTSSRLLESKRRRKPN